MLYEPQCPYCLRLEASPNLGADDMPGVVLGDAAFNHRVNDVMSRCCLQVEDRVGRRCARYDVLANQEARSKSHI